MSWEGEWFCVSVFGVREDLRRRRVMSKRLLGKATVRVLLATSMVLALRVLWRLPAERAASPDKPNVILVVLDQLDANHLHCYGNPRPTSPNIDRLAAQGVRFSHYYSVTDWTSPSYATMMTGVYPSRHTVTMGGKPEDPAVYEKLPMLAEEFKAHGYLTAAWGQQRVGRGSRHRTRFRGVQSGPAHVGRDRY